MAVRVIPAKVNTAKEEEQKLQRVAAYCRVSTDEENQETSYEAQVDHYITYISAHPGWELAGIYADEGISGTSTKHREQFNEMIADCEAGKIDMIITKSISRWARNTLDSLTYIRKLKDLGIRILFEKENIDTMGTSGELLITIMSSLAQQESASISQNVRMGIQYSFQQGKPRVNCERFLGYTKKRGGQLEIVPEQAEIVRRIYRDFLEGFTVHEIALMLGRDGIKTVTGKEQWDDANIATILKNEKYMGDLHLQKTYTVDFLTKKRAVNNGVLPQYYVENAHPPIVPKEVFNRVHCEMMQKKVDRHNGIHASPVTIGLPLAGITCCGKCGKMYRRYGGKNIVPENVIWRCSTRVKNRKACDGMAVNEMAVVTALTSAFNMLPDYRDDLIRMKERIVWGPMATLTRDIADIEARKKELNEMLGRYAEDSSVDVDTVQAELEKLEEQLIEKLLGKAELAAHEVQVQSALQLVNGMLERSEEYTPSEDACYDIEDFYRRTERVQQKGPVTEATDEMVKRFVEKIVVREGYVEVCFKAGVKIEVNV